MTREKDDEDIPLTAEHPKLQAFQDAVRDALLKRIGEKKTNILFINPNFNCNFLAQEEEKASKLRKATAARRQERMEQTKLLHEAQKTLKKEEKQLAQAKEEVNKVKRRR